MARSAPEALLSASLVSFPSIARAQLEGSVSVEFGGGRAGESCLRSCFVCVAMLQYGGPATFMCDPTVGRQVRHGRGGRNGGKCSWSAPWSDNAIYAPGRHKQRETGKRVGERQTALKPGLRLWGDDDSGGEEVCDAGKQDTKVKWVRGLGCSRWEGAPRRTSGGGTLGSSPPTPQPRRGSIRRVARF